MCKLSLILRLKLLHNYGVVLSEIDSKEATKSLDLENFDINLTKLVQKKILEPRGKLISDLKILLIDGVDI